MPVQERIRIRVGNTQGFVKYLSKTIRDLIGKSCAPKLTFVGLEPAVSFSRNTGMAKVPNAGVALRQRLSFVSIRWNEISVPCSPKADLEIVRTNTELIVRGWSKSDRKVAEQDIEHRLPGSVTWRYQQQRRECSTST